MEQMPKWGSDINKAMDEARRSGKLLLFFFHSKMCSGCQAMINKTLPERSVDSYISDRFVPLAYEISEPGSQDLVKRYNVEWTPTFILADDKGNEVYRMVGYLPPNDYLAQLVYGEGKAAFKKDDFDRANKCFNRVVEKYPDSSIAPEAMYYAGVSMFKKSHDASNLNKTYDRLKSKYPDSDWTKKASVWQ